MMGLVLRRLRKEEGDGSGYDELHDIVSFCLGGTSGLVGNVL